MKINKRDDGMYDLLSNFGEVLATGTKEAIEAVLENPLQLSLLESSESVHLIVGEEEK